MVHAHIEYDGRLYLWKWNPDIRPLVNEWAKWFPELDNTVHTTVTDEIDVSAGEPALLLSL